MPYARPEALVTSDWLAAHLGDPNVRVVDGSYKQPGITPTAREDYDAGHIPGAVFFDIDDVAEPGTSLPHMIPSAQRFARKMVERGIGNEDRVIVYDAVGLSSAGRPWWLLRLFGHNNVALLDGGLPHWKAEGRRLENCGLCSTTLASRSTSRWLRAAVPVSRPARWRSPCI
jgi:thiosulfate/3-mercaptopyruvate sulfurtransferase